MSSSPRPKSRRAAVAVVLLGLGVVALGVWFSFHRRLLLAQYHSARLTRAQTFEEAKPWLEELVRDAEDLVACDAIVSKLAEDQERLTFWFFAYICWGPKEEPKCRWDEELARNGEFWVTLGIAEPKQKRRSNLMA